MGFSRCANEMIMAAAREGQEAAAREGQEAAAWEGQEAAARDGQEAAARDGKEAAARDGPAVDQILCSGLAQIETNCSQVLAACFGPADTEQMVQNQVAGLLQC
jgi:hypothetical protein